jgi:xanthine dehydrogenase iron-sulfur cluster and FAD-binding subunit A
MRASAAYRMKAAQNCLRRFWHERGAPGDEPTRVLELANG